MVALRPFSLRRVTTVESMRSAVASGDRGRGSSSSQKMGQFVFITTVNWQSLSILLRMNFARAGLSRGHTNTPHSMRLPLCDEDRRGPTSLPGLHPAGPIRVPWSNRLSHPTKVQRQRGLTPQVGCPETMIYGTLSDSQHQFSAGPCLRERSMELESWLASMPFWSGCKLFSIGALEFQAAARR